jgi:hypothetical protein
MKLGQIVRGVIGTVSFRERVYCQTCGYDVTDGRVVVSPSGRAYCDSKICLVDAAVTGDEVVSPQENGRTYLGKGLLGFAVGSGKLICYKEPPMIRKSSR